MPTTLIPTHEWNNGLERPVTVATITTSLSNRSVSTRGVEILEACLSSLGVAVVRVDVVKLPPTYASLDNGPGWAAASELVAGADAAGIGLGMHGWSPSAISKSAVELLGSPMTGKPAGFVVGQRYSPVCDVPPDVGADPP